MKTPAAISTVGSFGDAAAEAAEAARAKSPRLRRLERGIALLGNTCFKFKFKEVVMLWFRHGPVKETREGGALLRTLRE